MRLLWREPSTASPALSSSAAVCVSRSASALPPARRLDLRLLSYANYVNVLAVFPRAVSYVLGVLQRHASLVEAGGASFCPWLGHPFLLLGIITIHSNIDAHVLALSVSTPTSATDPMALASVKSCAQSAATYPLVLEQEPKSSNAP